MKRYGRSGMPLVFTKCTHVPAFGIGCRNGRWGRYGRIQGKVDGNRQNSAELSHRWLGSIIEIVYIRGVIARIFSLHFNISRKIRE